MKQLILLATLTLQLVGCSSVVKDTDYIQLEGATARPKSSLSHTIFDPEEIAPLPELAPVVAEIKTSKSEPLSLAPTESNESNGFQTYLVKADDNLSYIAFVLLGKRSEWRTLQKWNPKVLAKPTSIFEGMEIKFQKAAIKKNSKDPAPGFQIYVVERNDNLAKISTKLLGDKIHWKQIILWNPEIAKQPHLIIRGMELIYLSPDREPAKLNHNN